MLLLSGLLSFQYAVMGFHPLNFQNSDNAGDLPVFFSSQVILWSKISIPISRSSCFSQIKNGE